MTLRYEFVPPSAESRLDHVGTYQRTLPVSLERMYENALDWEHLPHLHASSFTSLDLVDAGAWGWRASVASAQGQESLLELRLDRSARRWITRNIEGPSVGAEIWTHVFVTAPRSLDLVIDFFVPGVVESAREKVGLAYARAYEKLYDEDVWMMTERQAQLDRRLDTLSSEAELELAIPDDLELPRLIELSGRQFYLNKLGDDALSVNPSKQDPGWVVYPAACPHQQGPLQGDLDAQGGITCPWHGYRFDVLTGECTNGASCRFGRRPNVEEVGATLRIAFPPEA